MGKTREKEESNYNLVDRQVINIKEKNKVRKENMDCVWREHIEEEVAILYRIFHESFTALGERNLKERRGKPQWKSGGKVFCQWGGESTEREYTENRNS